MSLLARKISKLAIVFTAAFPRLVFAQPNVDPGVPGGPTSYLSPLGISNVIQLIEKILDALQVVAVPVAVGFIAYAGFLYITARGDSGQLETAKKALLWAIVGLAIVFAARILGIAIKNSVS